VAFYPGCDLREKDGKKLRNIIYSSYVPPNQSRTDPRVSPAFMDSTSLPPTFLVTCENDDRRSEAEEWAKRMQDDGARVTVKLAEKVGHGWDILVYSDGSHKDKIKQEAYAAAIDFLRECQQIQPM